MDDFDRRILKTLQSDGRIQNKELADRIGLSPAPCLRRTRDLENTGIIEGYTAKVSPKKVGFHLLVYATVGLKNQGRQSTESFEKAVQLYPNVIECSLMTGTYDYLLKVVARDITDYERFLMDDLTQLDCVGKVETSISMRTVKSSGVFPI